MVMLILIVLGAFFKGVMDSLQFHYQNSIFRNLNAQYWDPSKSWRNKYKGGDPSLGPKFIGSTTFLVWISDGWHLMQMFFLNSMILAIVFYTNIFNIWIDFIILTLLFKIIFQCLYTNFKR